METKAQTLGSLAMVAVALVVLAYLALLGDGDARTALISVVSAGVGYFLRGRVEKQ